MHKDLHSVTCHLKTPLRTGGEQRSRVRVPWPPGTVGMMGDQQLALLED